MENVKRVLPVGTVTGVTSALFHLSEVVLSCGHTGILEGDKRKNVSVSQTGKLPPGKTVGQSFQDLSPLLIF